MALTALRRTLTALLLACACQATPAAVGNEPGLLLDPALKGRPAPPAAHSSSSRSAIDSPPLELSRELRLPELPSETVATLHAQLSGALLLAWATTACLLLLHLAACWLRVLRWRISPPPAPLPMEHAPWPVISLLLPPLGSLDEQAQRIAALSTAEFAYPAERIHFVIVFDSAPRLMEAANRLERGREGRIHALALPGANAMSLPELLEAALPHSVGDALVVLDQTGPQAPDWLRATVTPLLDPATALVLARAVHAPARPGLQARLELLADRAESLLATQADALALLLAGQTQTRAVRREAIRALLSEVPERARDSRALAIELNRRGWQMALSASPVHYPTDSGIHAPTPGLRPALILRSLMLALRSASPFRSRLARLQAARASRQAACTLLWQMLLVCTVGLYFVGETFAAGLGMLLVSFCCFDPHGRIVPPLRIPVAARASGAHEEIRLLPLAVLRHIARLLPRPGPRARRATKTAPVTPAGMPNEQRSALI